MQKALVIALGCLSIASMSAVALAHTLSISTARVALRDRHIEVMAEWDAFSLVGATPTSVATMADPELEAVHGRWLARLSGESRLAVDGQVLPLRVAAAPTRDELRATAAQLSAAGQDHGVLLRVRLDGPLLADSPRQVAWTSPEALGPVLVSFVQPASRLAAPGEQVAFAVLESRASAALPSGPTPTVAAAGSSNQAGPSTDRARHEGQESPSAWAWAAGLAGVALGAWIGRRRPPIAGGGA